MGKPKKLVRTKVAELLPKKEVTIITDLTELNQLYALKIQEEVEEIKLSGHNDVLEFVDLIQAALSFAEQNGFPIERILEEGINKRAAKGVFTNLALNNLNPHNPSNKLYFGKEEIQFYPISKKPKPSKAEDGYSVNVIVYEIDGETGKVRDSSIGFFNYSDNNWYLLHGEYNLTMFCWSYIPTVPSHIAKGTWETLKLK